MKAVLAEGYDAVFVGSGAPRGRDLDVPGRQEAAANIHIGLDWLSSVSFGHITKVGKRVIVLGGGNTAMDCCRTARRLGGDDVKVIVRSGFDEMKASPWEKEDAMGEDIPILNMLVPKEVKHDGGKINGVLFEKVKAEYDDKGRRSLMPTGEPDEFHPVRRRAGRDRPGELRSPGSRRTPASSSTDGACPSSTSDLAEHAAEGVLRRRRRFRPEEHHLGRRARPRRGDLHPQDADGENREERPAPASTSPARRWASTSGATTTMPTIDHRFKVPHRARRTALKNLMAEVELGFDAKLAVAEAARCLNCDIETVFSRPACIECDACVDICPTDCITFIPDAPEDCAPADLNAPALNHDQALYVRRPLRPAASWPRTKTSACIAACAPSAARRARGTCRNSPSF